MVSKVALWHVGNAWTDVIPVFDLLSKKVTQAAMSLKDNSGKTALHAYLSDTFTWSKEWLGITRALLENTTDLRIQNKEGMTMLHCAIKAAIKAVANPKVGGPVTYGPEVIKLLLDTIGDSAEDNDAGTLLQCIMLKPAYVCARVEHELSMKREADNDKGAAADLMTIYPARVEIKRMVKALLNDPTICQTLLVLAMANQDCPGGVLKLLLAGASNLTLVDASGNTLLHCYLSRSTNWDEEVVKNSIQAIDLSTKNILGLALLDVAVRNAYTEDNVLNLLLERFELDNYSTVQGDGTIETVLCLTVREQDLKSYTSPALYKVTKITASEVPVQSTEDVGGYNEHDKAPVPLEDGSTYIANTYPQEPPRSNFRDQKHSTKFGISLFNTELQNTTFSSKLDQSTSPYSSVQNFEEATRTLLAKTKLENGRSAQAICLESELFTIMDLLLRCNNYLEIRDNSGRRLLHAWALDLQKGAKIIALLLDNRVNTNTQGEDEQTVPYHGISSRSMELVNRFIKRDHNTSGNNTTHYSSIRDTVDNTSSNNTSDQKANPGGIKPSHRDTLPIAGRKLLQPKGVRRRINRRDMEVWCGITDGSVV